MKPEVEVARDAVRAVFGHDVADALEWAVAAVRHRATLLSAAQWAAGESGEPCVDCGFGVRSSHDVKCPTAAALHALDWEWNRKEIDRAHEVAAQMLYGWAHQRGASTIPPHPPFPELLSARVARALNEGRPLVHQSGGPGGLALCGEPHRLDLEPPGSPTVTCPVCLARLFPVTPTSLPPPR